MTGEQQECARVVMRSDGTFAVENSSPQGPEIKIEKLHFSCKSVRPHEINDTDKYAGLILYAKDGKTEWECNGVRCKAGYVYITKSEDTSGYKLLDEPKLQGEPGMIHGAAYKQLFGESAFKSGVPTVTGSGFSIQGGKMKFNSYSFNSNNGKTDDFHTPAREMNEVEQIALENAYKAWKSSGGQQNHTPDGTRRH